MWVSSSAEWDLIRKLKLIHPKELGASQQKIVRLRSQGAWKVKSLSKAGIGRCLVTVRNPRIGVWIAVIWSTTSLTCNGVGNPF
jgi:hypothetical protein